MNSLQRLWRAEPILVALVTNAAFWPTAFELAAVFHHPVSDPQQHALIAASALITSVVLRQTVTAPDTAHQQIADIQSAHQKVGA